MNAKQVTIFLSAQKTPIYRAMRRVVKIQRAAILSGNNIVALKADKLAARLNEKTMDGIRKQ